jgi:hypothetical protein
MKRIRLFLRGIATLALLASSAKAGPGYAITPLDPSSPGSDWYTTESLDLRGHLRPEIGVLADWAYAPLMVDLNGVKTRVLTDTVAAHGRASLVLWDRFRCGIDSPLTIYQHGDAPQTPSHEQAPGDLRIDGHAMIFGRYGEPVRMAGGLELFAPFGRRDVFTSDGTFRIAPNVALAGDARSFAWAAKATFMGRPYDGTWQGRELGSQVALALSAGVQVNDRFTMGPEALGTTVVTGRDAFKVHAFPIELLIGGKVRLGREWQLGSAIGGRVTAGDGGAKMRVLAALEYAPR